MLKRMLKELILSRKWAGVVVSATVLAMCHKFWSLFVICLFVCLFVCLSINIIPLSNLIIIHYMICIATNLCRESRQ